MNDKEKGFDLLFVFVFVVTDQYACQTINKLYCWRIVSLFFLDENITRPFCWFAVGLVAISYQISLIETDLGMAY